MKSKGCELPHGLFLLQPTGNDDELLAKKCGFRGKIPARQKKYKIFQKIPAFLLTLLLYPI